MSTTIGFSVHGFIIILKFDWSFFICRNNLTLAKMKKIYLKTDDQPNFSTII